MRSTFERNRGLSDKRKFSTKNILPTLVNFLFNWQVYGNIISKKGKNKSISIKDDIT